jgi:hypothetical protein
MAALGAPSHSSTPDWTLAELRRYDDPLVLPAFQHFASAIDPAAFMPQEAIACYAHAVAGCARFLEVPPPLHSPATEEGRAWEAYGSVLFWIERHGLSAGRRAAECAPLWKRLETDLAFESVDPLYRMERTGWVTSKGLEQPLESLCRVFPNEVRRIMEFGLQHHSRLTSIFRGAWGADERRRFLIRRLGDLGTPQTVRLLEPWVEDDKLGPDAVAAIRKLRAGEQGR